MLDTLNGAGHSAVMLPDYSAFINSSWLWLKILRPRLSVLI